MPKRIEVPDLRLLEGVVSDKILDVAHRASKALTKAGVRHALIGGLAVGAYGYPRATKDVDFLVGDEGFEHHGGILIFKYGVPIEIDGVAVDSLSDEVAEDAVDDPLETEGIPIVDIETLIYLKLKAHRRRDQQDVVQLLRVGVKEYSVREYLQQIAPELIDKLDALVEIADEEE